MRRGVVNRGGLLASMVAGGCALGWLAPGAASATRLEIQFQAPAAGAIELIAVPYQVHFGGQPPPLHPAGLRVTLPRSGRPHSYGLLAGELRTRVAGHTATYVLLIEALRALTSASAAQPLVSDDANLSHIATGVTGTLRPTAQELVIDDGELKGIAQLLAQDGVSNPSAESFRVKSFDDGHAFGWGDDVAKQRLVWNDSWSLASTGSGVQAQVGKIEKTLDKPFKLTKPFELPEPAAPPHEEPTLALACPATATVGSTFSVTIKGPSGTFTLISTTPISSLATTTPFTIPSSGTYTDPVSASAPGPETFQAVGPKGETTRKCLTEVVPAA